jgi:hypothetical protein
MPLACTIPAVTDLPLTAPTNDTPDWHPAIFSALLALALFAVTLGGTYVYDDITIIQINPRVHEPARWLEHWTRGYGDSVDNLYRPLVTMSYAIQWWLHGDRPWAFHLVNALLHAACSAGVAELARRLTRSSTVALIAGLLFAAHPIHVEAVANIVGRAELACSAAVIGALIVFSRRPLTIGRALAVWALLFIAILSKEQGLLLPLMLLAMYYLDRADAPSADERKPMRVLILLMCWTMASYIVLRENGLHLRFWWDRGFLDWTQNPMVRAHGADRWLMPFVLFGHYVQLLFVPHKLSIDYGGSVIGAQVRLDDPWFYLGIVAAGAWGVATIVALVRRSRTVVLCLLCFGLLYGLVGNIVTLIGTNFGERLMYLPSAFLVILIAIALARLPRPARVTVTGLVLALACVRTYTYAARWNDRLAFLQSQARAQPRSVRIRLVLADEWIRRSEFARADEVMAAARAVQPDYAKVWFQSAVVAYHLDQLDRADRFLRRAIEIDPVHSMSSLRRMIDERRASTRPMRATSAPAH